jgi:hypothetical protein
MHVQERFFAVLHSLFKFFFLQLLVVKPVSVVLILFPFEVPEENSRHRTHAALLGRVRIKVGPLLHLDVALIIEGLLLLLLLVVFHVGIRGLDASLEVAAELGDALGAGRVLRRELEARFLALLHLLDLLLLEVEAALPGAQISIT